MDLSPALVLVVCVFFLGNCTVFSYCITALMDLQGNKALTSLPLYSTESDASLSYALRLAFKDHFGRIMIFMKNDHSRIFKKW